MQFDLNDRSAIEEGLARYCHIADFGEPDAMREVFLPEMVCRVAESGQVFDGLDEFVAMMTARMDRRGQMRHLCSGVCVRVADGRVTSECYVQILVRKEERWKTVKVGRYLDVWARSPAGWRIAERLFE